jgi:hypothetical protein
MQIDFHGDHLGPELLLDGFLQGVFFRADVRAGQPLST